MNQNYVSVLSRGYAEQQRPYSQHELTFMRNSLLGRLHIGYVRAQHKNCGHFYYTKEGGKKERDIHDKNTSDIGNCSVCWKLDRTPENLLKEAEMLVDYYMSNMELEPTRLIYNQVMSESAFYIWLYTEFN